MSGNFAYVTGEFSIQDSTLPAIINITAVPFPQETWRNVNISAIVNDNHQISEVWIEIIDPDGNLVDNSTMIYNGVDNKFYLNNTYSLYGYYNFTIWAHDSSYNWNSISGRFLIITIPEAPSDLITTAGVSFINVSWFQATSDDGSPVTNYRIYRGISPDNLTFLIEIGNVTYYNDTAVENGITYYYKISSVNAVGESLLSIDVNNTPQLDTDGDGIPDIEDNDDDNDGVPDEDDYFPLDSTKWRKPTEKESDLLIPMILLILIIAIVILIIFFSRKKNKKEG